MHLSNNYNVAHYNDIFFSFFQTPVITGLVHLNFPHTMVLPSHEISVVDITHSMADLSQGDKKTAANTFYVASQWLWIFVINIFASVMKTSTLLTFITTCCTSMFAFDDWCTRTSRFYTSTFPNHYLILFCIPAKWDDFLGIYIVLHLPTHSLV